MPVLMDTQMQTSQQSLSRQDCVVQEQRGRWSSVEAIGNLGWSGTAFLGGWLIDRYSYSLSFHATAAVQLIAQLVRCPLLPSLLLS